MKDGKPAKETNHSGGILGGMSDGSTVLLRAAIKPTPSIAQEQKQSPATVMKLPSPFTGDTILLLSQEL